MQRGWDWLTNSKKEHYFMENGISLCGKWAKLSGSADSVDGADDAPENCAECRRKIKKLREREAAEAQVG